MERIRDSAYSKRGHVEMKRGTGKMEFEAVILDMDGVVTKTARLHARAWKRMFDPFLRDRSLSEAEDLSDFDIEADYRRYIDGKPRFDGVRDFLAARGITLPEGEEDDDSDKTSVHGLGNRKNELFHAILREEGVETWPDAVEQIRRWRERGVRTGLITSSRNGRTVIEAAGLASLFDVMVDGTDADRLDVAGKPAPDVFLEAATRLGVEPAHAMVVEDAIAGVEAGRAGGFGLVVGVDRGQNEDLDQHGADLVVTDLRTLDEHRDSTAHSAGSATSPALDRIDEISRRMRGRSPVFFFDYDGTLAPIAPRPEEAVMPDNLRDMLQDLMGRMPVAIVSGRDLSDVRDVVGIGNLYYAGSHGFDIAGPKGMRMQHEEAESHLPLLDELEQELQKGLQAVEGAWVERKRYAVAVHYRAVPQESTDDVSSAVRSAHQQHPELRLNEGKKIYEFQPDVAWNKGHAVHWLLERLDLDRPDVLPFYFGDDTTDEDAFEALKGRGVGIRVGSPDEPTAADYLLRDTNELGRFIEVLMDRLERSEQTDG